MDYLFYIWVIFFLIINIFIIISDFRTKKIPNKFLLYLLAILPLYYGYLWYTWILSLENLWIFLLQIFITFGISFCLYYYSIWSAWDAKYLLVLSLFIAHVWIIPLAWNIWLITLFCLIWYFIYFFFIKWLFHRFHYPTLYTSIKKDLSHKFLYFKRDKQHSKLEIIKWFLNFLVLFTLFRLLRIYLLVPIINEYNWSELIQLYGIYLLVWLCLIIVLFIKIYQLSHNYFQKTLNKKQKKAFTYIFYTSLIFFLAHELIYSFTSTISILYLIFTLYLTIYLIFIILKYAYKLSFWVSEENYTPLDQYTPDMIIEKKWLTNITWTHGDIIQKYSINIDEINQSIIDLIWYINAEKKWNISHIKTLNTFAFWIYIFIWFLMTYILWDFIFQFIIQFIIDSLK